MAMCYTVFKVKEMGNKLAASIQQQVEQAITILKRGGIVACPTDTVYGVGAAINIERAVERVYQIKGRPLSRALPILLADKSQIAEVAKAVPPLAWRLADKFLPGALTIVLFKAESVPDIVTGGLKTIAVRIADHPVPIAIVRGLGVAIVGTSANLSGSPSALTAEEVRIQLGDRVDMIIDGGRCPGGRESTIIDLTGEIPRILRKGPISSEELKKVCPSLARA
ncbi:Threonylcarbamoyl-AMP synthase [subsurface metagenome]